MEGFASAFAASSEADWRRAAEAALKGGSLEALVSRTSDAIPLGPIYARRQGPRAARGSGGPWRVMARVDHPHAEDANAQALEDLENGADGLFVAFAGSAGAYGFGLRRYDAASLDRTFEGVRLDWGAAVELDLGPDYEAQARGVAALVARSGVAAGGVDVSFGLDPLGALARSGRAARSWADEAKVLAALAAELAAQGFAGPFVAADARPVHAAGGTPAQELSFALAAAVSYLRVLSGGGDVDALAERVRRGAPRSPDEGTRSATASTSAAGFSLEAASDAIAFRLAADADELVTLAKFRALRVLWARVREACGLAPKPTRIHAESAWRMTTARDPYVNVMRGAMAAFSAGLGGADSVSLLPFTQAIGLPDAFARRLARNTQLIQLRESHLGFVADPAAGAGAFEALTEALCEKAWTLFQAIEAEGGLGHALLSGSIQTAIAGAAAALRRDAGRMKTLITGVSAHPDLDEAKAEVLAAEPVVVEYPGELAATPLAPMRIAAPFERLRDACDKLAARPKVFLAAIGPASAHSRRVGFARELFEVGGLGVLVGAGDAFAASGAEIACICGSDEAYREHAEGLAKALKAAGAAEVWLAGRPGDFEAAWRAAGADGFIFAGGDAAATLGSILNRLGASL